MTILGMLLCALQALLVLAVICLAFWLFWWLFTWLLSTGFGVTISPRVLALCQIIAVLILAIIVLRALVTGDICGLGWWPTGPPPRVR